MRDASLSPDSQRVLAVALFELVHDRNPGLDRLAAVTELGEHLVAEALTELVRAGAAVMNDTGALVAAYPLSAVPTPHVVELASSAPWANCAIDALAVPPMVGQRGRVRSRCAHCVAPITVDVEGQVVLHLQPADAVVSYGRLADCCDRPSLESSCPYINFFCSAAHAAAWRRPATWQGRGVPAGDALALAVEWFRPITGIYQRHYPPA